MIYLHLLYCMAYKPRRSKKHHWEGENASAFYREKPQVLKKERGKVEKAMDVAIHDADRGSSVPALWSPRILHRSPKRYIMFLQDAVVCRYLQMMFQLVSTIISRYWLFFYLLYHCIDSEKSNGFPIKSIGGSCHRFPAGRRGKSEARRHNDRPDFGWWVDR